MKTRGLKTDYKLLAGVTRGIMNETPDIPPTLDSEADDPIVLSSTEEDFIPDSFIKQEKLTDV